MSVVVNASWTCEVHMTFDEPKNYSVDAVLTTDGQHYTARMSIRHGSHCPICGRKFKPGNHVAYLPYGNSDIIQIVHDSCLQAWQRTSMVRL